MAPRAASSPSKKPASTTRRSQRRSPSQPSASRRSGSYTRRSGSRTRKDRSKKAQPTSKKRVVVWSAVTLLLLSMLLIAIIIPLVTTQAVITLVPDDQRIRTEFTIQMGDDFRIENGIVTQMEGALFDRVIEETRIIDTLDTELVDDYATGTVTMVNDGTAPFRLVAQTRLRSIDGGPIFRIQEAVTIPAGGTINVAVKADTKGAAGNLPPTRFNVVALPPSAQEVVYARSDAPMEGGQTLAEVLTQTQLESFKTSFGEELQERALSEISTSYPDLVFPPNGAIATVEELTSNVEPGEAVTEVEISARIRLVALAFQEYSLLDIALRNLKYQVPQGYEFVGADPQSFQYSIDAYNLEEGTATFSVSLEGLSVASIQQDAFHLEELVGRDQAEAENFFEARSSVASADVYITPSWKQVVPQNPDHIQIVIDRPLLTPQEPSDDEPEDTLDSFLPSQDAQATDPTDALSDALNTP